MKPPSAVVSHQSQTSPDGPAVARGRLHHAGIIIGCVAVLLLSQCLTVHDGQLAFTSFVHNPMPDVCFFHTATGWDCPFCGLTRSFVALAHGQWRLSLGYHRLGWLAFMLVLAQCPYRIALLLMPGLSQTRMVRWIQRWALWVILALAAVNWVAGWFWHMH